VVGGIIGHNDDVKLFLGIFFFAFISILVATLFPFTFPIKELSRSSLLRFQFIWFRSARDLIENIILFVPLGFGLGGLKQNNGNNQFLNWTFVIAFGLCLSIIVESLQVLLPSRFPSSADIFSNSLGTAIGLLIFKSLGQKFINFSFDILRRLYSYLTLRNILIFLMIYVFFAIYMTMELNSGISFKNWDESFHLIIGNEKTGDRPWQGKVFKLKIFDQALSEKEIENIFSRKSTIKPANKSLLCFYELNKVMAFNDQTGLNPNLIWKGKTSEGNTENIGFILKSHWLETEHPATRMISKIKEKSQFTLAATVATADTSQSGPARIITISKDPYNRNLTLGQEGRDLVFRLRTPLTGKNGESPELVAPNIFADKNPHNLIVTYNGQSILLFVDGRSNPSSLAFSPGAVLWNYFYETNADDLFGYRVLYYLILLFPVLLMSLPLFINHKN
jgi:glycopeptide antibiotics resistance protein